MLRVTFVSSRGAIIFPPIAFGEACLDIHTEWVSDTSVANNAAIVAGGALRFPRSYSVEDYRRCLRYV